MLQQRLNLKICKYIISMVVLTHCIATKPTQNTLPTQNKDDQTWTLTFKNQEAKDIDLHCEVAYSTKKKSKGLMFREVLKENSCMIFIYDTPVLMHFWMKNTKIPLSIAYVSQSKKIMEIFNMQPHNETLISSSVKVQYAIEVNQGWFTRNKIITGHRFTIKKIE